VDVGAQLVADLRVDVEQRQGDAQFEAPPVLRFGLCELDAGRVGDGVRAGVDLVGAARDDVLDVVLAVVRLPAAEVGVDVDLDGVVLPDVLTT
jgi:hypothetical protein